MNKILFLMPVYPPHFDLALRFSESFFDFKLNTQADLAFVFTNFDEANMFKKVATFKYKEIILDTRLQDKDKKQGIINLKKFYGLRVVKDMYQYTIIVDAETIIIKNINLLKICKEFENKRILYGNEHLKDGKWIFDNSKKFFSKEISDKFCDELYLWFNQPCIYINKNLDDFFNQTNLMDLVANKDKISVGSFDYYIYMYYLIAYYDFKIKDLGVIAGYALLETNSFIPQSDEYKNIKFYWSSIDTYGFVNQKNVFMLMHIDRGLDRLKIKHGLHCAYSRVKNHLSYKIGKCVKECSLFTLPFYLFKIIKQHKTAQIIEKYTFKEKIKLNDFSDYQSALKLMKGEFYTIGNTLISYNKYKWGGGMAGFLYIKN